MTKTEYLKRIEMCLQDIPAEERRDAMSYYNDYFDEAGEENIREVIKELGSPEDVAAKIRENITDTVKANPQNNDAKENKAQKLPQWVITLMITGLVLIIVVPLFIAIGALIVNPKGNRDYSSAKTDTQKETQASGSVANKNSIKTLNINVDSCDVDIKISDSEAFEFDGSPELIDGKNTISMTDSSIDISHKNKSIIGGKNLKLTIFVPKGYEFEDVNIDLGAGELTAAELNTKDLDIELGAGNIVINNLTAQDIDCECGCGNVELYGSINGDLDAELGLGNLTAEITGKETDYNYKISCAMGNITIGDSSYAGFSSAKKIDNSASNTFNIDCALGNAEIFFK